MINLYIIRHGETAGNVRRLIQGVTNSHLNARGRKQAFALGVGLRTSGLKVERIVASDLIRAQETAQQILLGMQKKLPVETDSGLREQNDGIFEGRELEDVSQEVFQVPDYHQLVTSGKVPIEAIADGFMPPIPRIRRKTVNKLLPAMILPCVGLLQRRKQPASPMYSS